MIGKWLETLPDEALDRILTKPMGAPSIPAGVATGYMVGHGGPGCLVQVALNTHDWRAARVVAGRYDCLRDMEHGGSPAATRRINNLIRARCLRIKARRALPTIP